MSAKKRCIRKKCVCVTVRGEETVIPDDFQLNVCLFFKFTSDYLVFLKIHLVKLKKAKTPNRNKCVRGSQILIRVSVLLSNTLPHKHTHTHSPSQCQISILPVVLSSPLGTMFHCRSLEQTCPKKTHITHLNISKPKNK